MKLMLIPIVAAGTESFLRELDQFPGWRQPSNRLASDSADEVLLSLVQTLTKPRSHALSTFNGFKQI